MSSQKTVEAFEQGYGPGGIPLSTDRHLRGIRSSVTPEEHLMIIMKSYFCGRDAVSRERVTEGRIYRQ